MDDEQMMKEIEAEMPGLLEKIEKILDEDLTPVSLSHRDWTMIHGAVGAYIELLKA
jgi:hypothetical protein